MRNNRANLTRLIETHGSAAKPSLPVVTSSCPGLYGASIEAVERPYGHTFVVRRNGKLIGTGRPRSPMTTCRLSHVEGEMSMNDPFMWSRPSLLVQFGEV